MSPSLRRRRLLILAALLAAVDGALAHDVARWLLFALAASLVSMQLWLAERVP